MDEQAHQGGGSVVTFLALSWASLGAGVAEPDDVVAALGGAGTGLEAVAGEVARRYRAVGKVVLSDAEFSLWIEPACAHLGTWASTIAVPAGRMPLYYELLSLSYRRLGLVHLADPLWQRSVSGISYWGHGARMGGLTAGDIADLDSVGLSQKGFDPYEAAILEHFGDDAIELAAGWWEALSEAIAVAAKRSSDLVVLMSSGAAARHATSEARSGATPPPPSPSRSTPSVFPYRVGSGPVLEAIGPPITDLGLRVGDVIELGVNRALTGEWWATFAPAFESAVDVIALRVLGRYFVELTFSGGEKRVIDLEEILVGPAFSRMRASYEYFCSLRIDPERGEIVWPDRTAISQATLFAASKPSVPSPPDHCEESR